jgi:ribulose 1,5-bisphosphate carboxylase large subunit-like protein
LRSVCEDSEAPASARVSAAKAILDGAVKAVELQDLAARVEELEAALPPPPKKKT